MLPGTRVSIQTVRNRLHHAGLRSCRPTVRVPLAVRLIQARLDFTADHLNWTFIDWKPLLFTDEYDFV